MKRKIFVLSTSRADFGLIYPIISFLKKKADVKIILSGSHFEKIFGYTYKEVIKKNIDIGFKFKFKYKAQTKLNLLLNLSEYFKKLSIFFHKNNCDLFLILGDRYETLISAFAANFNGIPIAHISGGEVTEGSKDDSFRHAISKLSSLHFVSHKEHKTRLIQLGENKKNIFNFGSLGIENVSNTKLIKKEEIEKKLRIKFNKNNICVTYHPNTIVENKNEKDFKILMEALLDVNQCNIFILSPNADYGNKDIFKMINYYTKNFKNVFFIENLGVVKYFSLIRECGICIGNSSSILTEVPYIKKFSINVGDRQKGRISPKNVINVPFNKNIICNKILHLLKKNKNIKIHNINKTSIKISNTLIKFNLKKIFPKKFFDL
jgi:GDP/UDP-N,N'-diacetylbacillosamine 2-epimerase (hydrolysing)